VIVLTLGTFDLFHAGHVALLKRCSDLGNHVIVGLNTDAFVERYKGQPPLISYVDRETCLAACRWVDAVIPNDQTDGSALDVINGANPDIIAVGWDWRERDYLAQLGISEEVLVERDIRLVFLPYTPGAAGPSSQIRARMNAMAFSASTETRA
jgi:glycerol-3-phosphate cytidylyltransferase